MTAVQSTGPAYQVVNPATGEVGETFDYATDAEVEAALAAAHAAYAAWQDVPIEERREGRQADRRAVQGAPDELGAIATEEMGKPLPEAVGEADFCGDIFDYFATEGPSSGRRPADQDVLRRQGRRAEAARSDRCWGSCRGTTPSTRSPGSQRRT